MVRVASDRSLVAWTTIAKKHCNGTTITDGAQMIRITLPISGVVGIDWNGDLNLTAADVGPPGQDISFDGVTNISTPPTRLGIRRIC